MHSRPLALALAVTALAVAGCGSEEEPAAGPVAAEASAKKAATVAISDFKYDPEAIRIKAGGSVTWSSSDQARHNAQTDDGVEGAFNTGDLEKGASKKVTFEETGEFTYYCIYHRFMEARVEVVQ